MKAERLQELQSNGIGIPKFIVIDSIDCLNSIDLNFSKSDRFAVRSSSDIEDDTNESHAGQFKTILNVTRDNINTAVQDVFNSYLGESNGKVIIQEMIESKLSGVLFTANPIGILSEMVISVGEGLGENIVNNQVPVTTYHYILDTKQFIVEKQSYDNKSSPELDKEILDRLISLANHIKSILNYHSDIEFAIDKHGIISILQARPITTLSTNEIVLDNSNIVESYPGVVTPLTSNFAIECYTHIFKNCLLRITQDKELVESMSTALGNMVYCVNGRMYYGLNSWYSILKLIPFSNRIIDTWQDMLGVKNKDISPIYKQNYSIKTKAVILFNFIRYLLISPYEMRQLNNNFDKRFKKYRDRYDKARSFKQLYDLYIEIRKDILQDWDLTLINDMYTFINTGLAGKSNRQYISNIKQLKSMEPVIALAELAEIECGSQKYEQAKLDYISLYGDRVPGELKLETLTYRTNPELLDNYIKKFTEYETRDIQEQKEERGISNSFIRNAKIGIYNREISRLNRTRLFGLARDIALKMGSILNKHGKLDSSRDIFFLYESELSELYSEYKDIKKLIQERKEEYNRNKSKQALNRIIFSGKVLTNVEYLYRADTDDPQNKQDELFGSGISIGEVEGEALVIDSPQLDIDTTNKIIVTKYTDPGWVFLIKQCLGIVTEQGSLLSHTAIISRELGKTSIVSVKNATSLIKTGDKIKINGLTGKITIIDRLGQ